MPTSKPSTLPTGSLDSPRDALKWFAAALRDGDVPRLNQVIATSNEIEARMVGGIGNMAQALAGLNAAAVKAFGPDAAGHLTDDTTAAYQQTVARIDAAEVNIEGDMATVRYPDSKERPFVLHKVGAGWVIPAAQFSRGVPLSALDRQVREMAVQVQIVNDVTKDIISGKHRTPDAAGQAWRSKMMSALSATQPSTRTVPATSTVEAPKR